MKKGSILLSFCFFVSVAFAQISTSGCYLSGALLQQNPLAGCGNQPNYCNLASVFVPAFSPSACGTSTLSGGVAYTLNTSVVLPAGCTATIQAEYMKRNAWGSPINPSGTGCSNSGMDGSPDALKILSSGGTIISQTSTITVNVGTCAAYPALGTYTSGTSVVSPGCNNADAAVEMIVTGGTFSIGGVSNRSDELITYTINMSGTCGPGCSLVLPVELARFNADVVKDKIELSWTTLSEKNLYEFVVEKSSDAVNWQKLTEIYPTGSLYDIYSYSTTDPFPFQGINYYRLVSVDLDGSRRQSNIVPAVFRGSFEYWYVQDERELSLYFPENMNNTFQIIDMEGRTVNTITANNERSIRIPKENIPPGIYLVAVNGVRNIKNKLIVY